MQSVDRNIEQISFLGLVDRSIVMGPVVARRRHGANELSGSPVLIQAAISTEHGTAAVFWNVEDFAFNRHDSKFEAEAMKRARPLRECSRAVQAMVWPHLATMLGELLNRCRL